MSSPHTPQVEATAERIPLRGGWYATPDPSGGLFCDLWTNSGAKAGVIKESIVRDWSAALASASRPEADAREGCKDRGAHVGASGECLSCSAEAGENASQRL